LDASIPQEDDITFVMRHDAKYKARKAFLLY